VCAHTFDDDVAWNLPKHNAQREESLAQVNVVLIDVRIFAQGVGQGISEIRSVLSGMSACSRDKGLCNDSKTYKLQEHEHEHERSQNEGIYTSQGFSDLVLILIVHPD
jgi:hypothetical protein